jgi:hypothetical protein
MDLAIISCNTVLNGMPPGTLPVRATHPPSLFEAPRPEAGVAPQGDGEGPFMVKYAA